MQLQGFRSRVRIGPISSGAPTLTFYGVKTWSASDEAEGLDTSNTEGYRGGTSASVLGFGTSAANGVSEPGGATGLGPAAFGSRTPGLAVARIELTSATMMYVRNNPFDAPRSFRTQMYCTVIIYPNRGVLSFGHYFPYALITSLRHEGDVSGLQPVTLTLETDGEYELNKTLGANGLNAAAIGIR